MFKFFRKYNKYILAVGAALLMVAFLVQGTLDQVLGRNPAKVTIGRIDGAKVRRTEVYAEGQQLTMLRSLLQGLVVTDEIQWLLMKREARAMGLSASEAEVDMVLAATGRSPDSLARFARSNQIPVAYLRGAIRDWVMIETYRELVYGRVHLPLTDKINFYRQLQTLLDSGYPVSYVRRFVGMLSGDHRVSGPLIERFVHQSQSTVKISAIEVSAAEYAKKVDNPSASDLGELFEQYKDQLPGQGRYGFGYRIPNRVRLEYLVIPGEALRQKAAISEVQALEHYDANPDRYTALPESGDDGASGEPKLRPYEQVREEILQTLRQEESARIGREMINEAQLMLLEHDRLLKRGEGEYFVLDDAGDWAPLPLERLAERIQEKFAILPTVHGRQEKWLMAEDLARLEGLGQSRTVGGKVPYPFVPYALSAKELAPADENPLVTLRLQKGIVSLPMRGLEGSFFLFRLTDAEPEHVPASVDDVRLRLTIDAKRLAAFEMLLGEQAQWLARGRSEPFEQIAASIQGDVLNPGAFPRRASNYATGMQEVPRIGGIGQDEALVDRIFEMAEAIGTDAASASVDSRVDAITIDGTQSLILFRIDAYTPVTRSRFVESANEPYMIHQLTESMTNVDVEDPLSFEALAARMKFEFEVREDSEF